MALTDRPIVKRLIEEAEERIGVTIAPTRELSRLKVAEQEFGEFRQEAEELAFYALDYFGGRPSEMRPERRRRLAQRSRIALLQDPLAGAEAQLLADFAFGKGVAVPTAREEKVQKVVDDGWSDPINEQVLFGYAAQRKISNEILTTGELFPTTYVRGGKVRFGRLDPDLVVNVVPDPEHRLIPLWFVVRKRSYGWNYDTDSPAFMENVQSGRLAVEYWDHWRNVDIAIKEREDEGSDGLVLQWSDPAAKRPPKAGEEQPLVLPPDDRRAEGKVYHLAINQTGEQLRGNPPWARSLRFMSAMNVLTEAHVTMAQAASSFIARRAVRGSPRQISKAASEVLSQAGELGASWLRPAAGWGVGGNAEPTTEPFTKPSQPGPFPPGSWWTENMDSSKLESLNLSSGAAQMAQTAQIVRAPVAASSGFGQHYLGDTSNANLASASTLELPATMHIAAWQEWIEGMYRWATDRIIEAAVQAGLLGGAEGFPDEKPMSEMRLDEASDRQAAKERTGRDLSYEFSMPFPGRRQLVDVVQVVQVTSQTQDPNGVNIPLRRILLKFLFEQLGIDDVAHAVDECLPEGGMPGGIGPQQATGTPPGSFSAAGAGGGGAAGPAGAGRTGAAAGAAANDPGEGQQPYGAKSGTQGAGGSSGDGALESEDDDAAVEDLVGATRALFRDIVLSDRSKAALGLSGNGGSS